MFCVECGIEIPPGAMWKFCPKCGVEVKQEEKEKGATKQEGMLKYLSPGAKDSFNCLKRRYEAVAGKCSSVVDLHVQLLGEDRKGIRKLGDSSGKITIQVKKELSADDWGQQLAEILKPYQLHGCDIHFVKTKYDAFDDKLSMKDLQTKARMMHRKDVQVFAVLPKKRYQLEAMTGSRKQSQKVTTETSRAALTEKKQELVHVSSEEEEELFVDKRKKLGSSCKKEPLEMKCDKEEASATIPYTESSKVVKLFDEAEKTEAPDAKTKLPATETYSEGSSPLNSVLSCSLEAAVEVGDKIPKLPATETYSEGSSPLNSVLSCSLEAAMEAGDKIPKLPATETYSEGSSPLNSVLSCSLEAAMEAGDKIPSATNAQAEEDDYELEKFVRLQSRLKDRKHEASIRIRMAVTKKGAMKQFQIFYEARNNIGLTFKAPIDAEIGYLYDMVCLLLEADTLAPKFHFRSGADVYTKSFSGKIKEVPGVLHLVEEDFDADDTFTNFDDVVFAKIHQS